ncbi:MAG: Abi family protein [Methylobacter sp.]
MRVFFWLRFREAGINTFTKPAIDVAQQIQLLKDRGLIIKDEYRAALFLEAVSFFRLTPYMRPFQNYGDSQHHFKADVGFRQISQLYEFDRRLRLLVMDAIERAEVATRARISTHMGPSYGAHWYLEKHLFKNHYDHARLIDTINEKQQKDQLNYRKECARIDNLKQADDTHKAKLKQRRAQESYARHYPLTYCQPAYMPGWAMFEELTLGDLSHLYKGLANDADKKAIAKSLGISAPLFESWLHTLTTIRNICAHHGRLWNRELGIKPEKPKSTNLVWPQYLKHDNPHTRIAVVLAILHHLMQQVSPNTRWHHRIIELFSEFKEIPLYAMGLKDNWQEDVFWKF